MYGHEKGSFTGAHASRIGRLEQADKGTLFMDEIGNMPVQFQEKILRVLEYQEFQRVGGTANIKVDVRLISATNANLEELMDEGTFRADLYDRLSFAVLTIPPLRHRREEIPYLIVHIVQALRAEMPSLPVRSFDKRTVEALMEYHWPGNIRELKNIVERLYLYGTEETILPSNLPQEMAGTTPVSGSFHNRIEAFKKQLIVESLAENNNNQRKAATALEMTYDQFRHFYKKFCLDSI